MAGAGENHESCCSQGQSHGPGLTSDYWQTRYDEGKTGWDRGEPGPMLPRWLGNGALQPCDILVPGCGRGHEVVALAEAGFRVTAVDYADAATRSLRGRLEHQGLTAEVIQADIFEFEPGRTFDAIYEQTCLCAIHPSLWPTYEALLRRWLRVGGKLFALFMQTEQPEGPPFCCRLEEMRRLFSAGWTWLGQPQRLEHPMGLHELACVLERVETPS